MSAAPAPPRDSKLRRRRLLWALVALALLAGTFWLAVDRMTRHVVAEMDRNVLDAPRRDDSAHKPP